MSDPSPGSEVLSAASKRSLKRDDALLLVIDVQDRLAAAMPEKVPAIVNTVRLVEGAKLLSVPIIVTEQYPKGLGPTVPAVQEALPDHSTVEKLCFDCCGEESFAAALGGSGRKSMVIAGMEAHICVLQTALALLERGYRVHVVKDAVCSRAVENKEVAMGILRDAGATVTTTETVLFQLVGRAGTPEFKAISALIK